MECREIGYDFFIKCVKREKSTFLCGNGFSINFDSNYTLSALSSRLWNTHNYMDAFRQYDVISNKKYKDIFEKNFKCTIKSLKTIKSEKDFISLFSSAVDFADSLIGNTTALDWLKENGYENELVFGLKRIDLVYSISEQAKRSGDMFVNYEYWSVLIYYIVALQQAPSSIYSFDNMNIFVKAVLAGNKHISDDDLAKNTLMNVACNGMYTYLRFLFTSNILLEGKSFNVTELEKWDYYDISVINSFLSGFNYLITTNYDQLLEKITGGEVAHLHGSYSKRKRRIMSESLGIFFNGIRYDLTSAVIGDYFLAKTFLLTVAELSSSQSQNIKNETYSQILSRIIKVNQSNLIVIYGLNVDNDYHLLRNIQIYLGEKDIDKPHIIYCYYSDEDRVSFATAYEKCLTYSTALTDSIKEKVSVSTISSKEIAENIFIYK